MNERLKEARELSGKTQTQVALEANVSTRAYQYYESNQREPGVTTAILIADAIGVDDYHDFKELFGAATPRKV